MPWGPRNQDSVLPRVREQCRAIALLNRIEQAEPKMQKKLAKQNSTFLTFLGSAVLAGSVALFLFFLQLYPFGNFFF